MWLNTYFTGNVQDCFTHSVSDIVLFYSKIFFMTQNCVMTFTKTYSSSNVISKPTAKHILHVYSIPLCRSEISGWIHIKTCKYIGTLVSWLNQSYMFRFKVTNWAYICMFHSFVVCNQLWINWFPSNFAQNVPYKLQAKGVCWLYWGKLRWTYLLTVLLLLILSL